MSNTRNLDFQGDLKHGRREQINPQDISTEDAKAPWIVALLNHTDECFVYLRTKNMNVPAWGKWTKISAICRTCPAASTVKYCFDNSQYKELMVTECNSPAFQLQIATAPDAQGYSLVVTSDAIQPNCGSPGIVLNYT